MKTENIVTPTRALVSVSDKEGIVEFVSVLAAAGVEILSTGGTSRVLKESGISVVSVSEHTGFPELMDGRLKTLHPKIHGGILGRNDIDCEEMQQNDIQPIDLVVVNLYPFEQVSADPTVSRENIIENIDIGGPAMIRAAAKNFAWTCVVVDSSDYADVLDEMHACGGIRLESRRRLAAKAFARTAFYDSVIADYMGALDDVHPNYPETLNLSFRKFMDMRYGENPHQSAAFYIPSSGDAGWFRNSKMLQGKPLSFNNVADADAAYECIAEFSVPSCVIIKHATPCGVASAVDISTAYELAYRTDPTSAFGGIIAINRPLNERTASLIIGNQFVEVILAPGVDSEALEILKSKENIRVLEHLIPDDRTSKQKIVKMACGGVLIQDSDSRLLEGDEPKVVTERNPEAHEIRDLLFAWKVAKHVKSNAIVYVKDLVTVGLGAGQMSRVDSARIALSKAEDSALEVAGAVMASDAFFPFRDGIDTAAKSGIRAVIQPGGSMRDDEVIKAANEHGLVMVFTGMRHFRH